MDNPLLVFDQLPPFSRIEPDQVEPALDQLLTHNRERIANLLEPSREPTWANLVYPIEILVDRLSQAWSPVRHLNSVVHNWRIRLRVFAKDDAFPVLPSVIDVWSGVNWYEREAFDLFGIVFEGHPDLRRILTDYGFVGHPFRKDFPLSGHVEMRFDPEQGRVVYQPVTIEPREITPRIIREQNYADNE